MQRIKINYDVELSDNVSDILEQDFWICDEVTTRMLLSADGPIKFSAATSIFVSHGKFTADINLKTYEAEAPCVINIREGEILQKKSTSDDFQASFVVMSKKLIDALFMFISDTRLYSSAARTPMLKIAPEDAPEYAALYVKLREITSKAQTPNSFRAILFTLLAFFYSTAITPFEASQSLADSSTRLTDRFVQLVEEHFRTERFLDFYADKLGVSSKHLSKVVKKQTGATAVNWIEKYVILEAKVLLKSTNLTVQQIADNLNFPSQSFFGKYFKKLTGMTPREFRSRGIGPSIS